ncbi:MAG: family 20 glycosylhydrolase, partial [Bacteroidales bacterium]|nr:family 20 glycosylhydrolase [Bacteroidales bacterium]
FEFLENVLSEVIDMFPSEYIHIGGDECPKAHWAKCSHCQQRIREEGLEDEHELQSYFIQRIESFLNSKGRKLIGWDEILEGGLAENAAVMSWRGEEGGIAAANMGHYVVMTPGNWCYFDHYQSDFIGEPLAIGGLTPLQEVYNYDPMPAKIDSAKRHFILGVQANVWTEYIATPEHAEYMIFPRLCAMAEVQWTPPGKKNYDEFLERMMPHYSRLSASGIKYRVPIPDSVDQVNN